MNCNESIILETKQLTHLFSDGTMGITDINLKIYAGDFLILAGANGSGKTVLTRHLNGLLKPTKGEVLFNGTPVGKNLMETRQNVGLIFQDSDSQFVGQTVKEEVAFGPENLNLPREKVEKVVTDALVGVGLEAFITQRPHTLSGGQKRKLAVAGVLAMNPSVIIFDEPFTGLDYPGVKQVLKQLVTLHQSGHTIIVVTHELEKVLAHSNRLVVMSQGTLVLDGKPALIIDEIEKYGVRMPLKEKEGIETLTWL